MADVLVLNGANLGRLGTRQPEVYGTRSLDELRQLLSEAAPGKKVEVLQTDDEATLISWLHGAADTRTPVILNAGAWTHYSLAIADAVTIVRERDVPVVEVHLSNIYARDEFRHSSVLSPVVSGVIVGFGFDSYRLALAHVLQ